jgi:hypothetical protein
MLFLLQIHYILVVFANMCDTFLNLRKRRYAVLCLLCLSMFLLGLYLTTRKGYDGVVSKGYSSIGRLPIFILL